MSTVGVHATRLNFSDKFIELLIYDMVVILLHTAIYAGMLPGCGYAWLIPSPMTRQS